MVGGHFTGDWVALLLGTADQLNLAAAGDVDNMQRHPIEVAEGKADRQHQLFGVDGDGAEASGFLGTAIANPCRPFRPTTEETMQQAQFINAETAKGVAHVDFEATGGLCHWQIVVQFGVGGADKDADVTAGFGLCQRHLFLKACGGAGRRQGVGHVKHHGHTAGQGSGTAGGEIFFMGIARLTQVDVGIDQAG